MVGAWGHKEITVCCPRCGRRRNKFQQVETEWVETEWGDVADLVIQFECEACDEIFNVTHRTEVKNHGR